jgi:phage gp36-like protein
MSTQYATRTDLERLGLNPLAFASIDNTTVDAMLLAASAKADSYLRGRYDLPLQSWGDDLRMLVSWIAAYMLLGSRGYNPSAGADETIRLRYEDAIRELEGVERQRVHLDVTPSFREGSRQQLPQVRTSSARGW